MNKKSVNGACPHMSKRMAGEEAVSFISVWIADGNLSGATDPIVNR